MAKMWDGIPQFWWIVFCIVYSLLVMYIFENIHKQFRLYYPLTLAFLFKMYFQGIYLFTCSSSSTSLISREDFHSQNICVQSPTRSISNSTAVLSFNHLSFLRSIDALISSVTSEYIFIFISVYSLIEFLFSEIHSLFSLLHQEWLLSSPTYHCRTCGHRTSLFVFSLFKCIVW